jgi:hypothetical protein
MSKKPKVKFGNDPDTIRNLGAVPTNAAAVQFNRGYAQATTGVNPPPKTKTRGGDFASLVNKVGYRPVVPATNEIVINARSKFELPAGFYLLSGSTGGGKSITSAAIALTAAKSGVDVRYFYCNEARTPAAQVGFGPNPFHNANNNLGRQFINTCKTNLTPAKLGGKGTCAIAIIDSIALPLRAYRSADRKNSATMKEGLQPMDIEFVVEMEQVGIDNSVAIIGIINEDLVPFSAKLEGMAEGMINVTAAGRFSLRHRSAREFVPYTLEPDAVAAAAEFLHYPDKSSSRTNNSGFNII